MEEGYIEILHKEKGSDNTIRHRMVYAGKCVTNCRYSVREQMGGVENNSDIEVRILGKYTFPVDTGDRCILNGKVRTVRRWSRCANALSADFCHTALSLR